MKGSRNFAEVLSGATHEPALRPKKLRKPKVRKRIHIQAQKYHLVPQWRRRRP